MELTLASSTREISLNSDSIYLQPELEGLTGLPNIRSTNGVSAGSDGGWTSAQFFDARSISIKCVIANEDEKVVENKRRELMSLLAQGKTEELELRFTTSAGNAYMVKARVTGTTAPLGQILKKQDVLIQLRADDPLIYAYNEEGGTVATLFVLKATGGFEIPFQIPLVITGGEGYTAVSNVGTEVVYPNIVLNGPLHNPQVINQTNNQKIELVNTTLSSTDVVEIDTRTRTVTLNGSDVYDYLSEDSSFLQLEPGDNTMALISDTASDTGSAQIKFKQGFITI